jgi:hypothetical protein
MHGVDLTGSGHGPVDRYREQQTTRRHIPEDDTLQGNETSGSIYGGKCADQLSYCRLLTDAAS